jgi:hypothetical protein
MYTPQLPSLATYVLLLLIVFIIHDESEDSALRTVYRSVFPR